MKEATLVRTDQSPRGNATPEPERVIVAVPAIRRMLPIGLIVVLALSLRLYLVTGPQCWLPRTVDTEAGGYIQRGMKLSGNPGPDHDRVAQNFLAGHGLVNDPGLRHTTRPPLYPLLVAASYTVFGRNLLPVGVLHAVLGALSCLLVWQAARMMSTGTVALIASGIAAVLPEFLKYTPRLYESTLVIFLTAALVLVLFVSRERASLWWPILAGVVLGLIALTRLELMVLLPFIALWQLIDGGPSRRRRLAGVALTTAAFILVISPWLVHNRTTSIDDLADAGGGRLGLWLWERIGPHARTVWEDPPTGPRGAGRGLGAGERIAALWQLEMDLSTSDPDALDSHLKREAVDFATRHPLRVVPLMASRVMMLWSIWPTPPPALPFFFAYWAFLVVGLMGAIAYWRQPEMRLLMLLFLGVTLFYGFLHGHPRYRLPANVAVLMMVSVGLMHIWDRLRMRRLVRGGNEAGQAQSQPSRAAERSHRATVPTASDRPDSVPQRGADSRRDDRGPIPRHPRGQ